MTGRQSDKPRPGVVIHIMGLPAGEMRRHHLLRCVPWKGPAIPCEPRLASNTFSFRLIAA